jgi:hypothetical protein
MLQDSLQLTLNSERNWINSKWQAFCYTFPLAYTAPQTVREPNLSRDEMTMLQINPPSITLALYAI